MAVAGKPAVHFHREGFTVYRVVHRLHERTKAVTTGSCHRGRVEFEQLGHVKRVDERRSLPGLGGSHQGPALATGALRNARNVYGATALDIAMREGRDDAADALRDA